MLLRIDEKRAALADCKFEKVLKRSKSRRRRLAFAALILPGLNCGEQKRLLTKVKLDPTPRVEKEGLGTINYDVRTEGEGDKKSSILHDIPIRYRKFGQRLGGGFQKM